MRKETLAVFGVPMVVLGLIAYAIVTRPTPARVVEPSAAIAAPAALIASVPATVSPTPIEVAIVESKDTVPPMRNIAHAFTVLPKGTYNRPAEKIADAQAVIARWKVWKAKPTGELIPFSDWANARTNLTDIKPADPEFAAAKELAAALDAFGIELANIEIKQANQIREKEKTKAAAALLNDVPGRKDYARQLEEKFLRASMDAVVSTEGEKATTLRVKYIGFTRPAMFKLQEEGKVIPDIIAQSRQAGFRKVHLWNGYDLTWTWDLTKQ